MSVPRRAVPEGVIGGRDEGARVAGDAPLRVAVLAHVRHPIRPPFAGGVEAHTWHLAHGLAARGHEVTLFAAGDSDAGVPLFATVDEHYERRLPWARFRESERLRSHLRRAFERACRHLQDGHDIVHNNTLHPLPIEHARRTGLPMLTSLHVPPFPALRGAVDGSAFPTLRYTVTSRRQREIWWAGSPPDEAHTVHNGIDPDDWPFHPNGDGTAVWAGRITPNKGTHLAAEAARLAGVELSIVGPIEDRAYYLERVVPLLDERVRHLGHLDGRRLAERVGRASVLLFTPLWEEPFGLIAIEAMASGVPIAYTDRGAAREVIGEGGVRAEGEDAASLASAMLRAREIAREVPRRRVERRFTIERMLDGYERLYRQCIAAAKESASTANLDAPSTPNAPVATPRARSDGRAGSCPDALSMPA